MADPLPPMSPARKLRHAMRGEIGCILLNVQCLPLVEGTDLLQTLDAIINSTDALNRLLDEFDKLPDEAIAELMARG
jgi:hypothetical protein